jgi:hypothetical protein
MLKENENKPCLLYSKHEIFISPLKKVKKPCRQSKLKLSLIPYKTGNIGKLNMEYETRRDCPYFLKQMGTKKMDILSCFVGAQNIYMFSGVGSSIFTLKWNTRNVIQLSLLSFENMCQITELTNQKMCTSGPVQVTRLHIPY